jgi:hypothetical protein
LDVKLVLNAGDAQTYILGVAVASLLLLLALLYKHCYVFVAVGIVAFGLASYLLFLRDYYCVRALVLMGLVDVALKKVQVLTLFVDLGFCGGPVERVLAALFNVDVARLLL